jgi:hypothetical protein
LERDELLPPPDRVDPCIREDELPPDRAEPPEEG